MDYQKPSLPIVIPPGYSVTNTAAEEIASPIPDRNPTIQVFVELTKDDKTAWIFYWDGPVMRDLGPMLAEESWKHTFLGKDASVSRTSMFMGRKQEVFVLHYKPDKTTQLMIYSGDMTRDEFHEMLDKMRLKEE